MFDNRAFAYLPFQRFGFHELIICVTRLLGTIMFRSSTLLEVLLTRSRYINSHLLTYLLSESLCFSNTDSEQ